MKELAWEAIIIFIVGCVIVGGMRAVLPAEKVIWSTEWSEANIKAHKVEKLEYGFRADGVVVWRRR